MIYDGIRLDATYGQIVAALDRELKSPSRLPLLISGVCG